MPFHLDQREEQSRQFPVCPTHVAIIAGAGVGIYWRIRNQFFDFYGIGDCQVSLQRDLMLKSYLQKKTFKDPAFFVEIYLYLYVVTNNYSLFYVKNFNTLRSIWM